MTAARSVAAAQTCPRRGDVDANVEGHVRLVHAAAEEQVRVLVFPELSLTGYELDLADALAFSESDPRLGPLIELASSCSMTLIVGAPVRVGPHLHIGAFVLSPDRSVDLYTKRWSDRGERLAQIEGSGAGIALAIEGKTGWRARACVLESA